MNYKILHLLLLYCSVSTHAIDFSSHVEHISNKEQVMTISCTLDDNESIFENSVHTSVDHPQLTIENEKITVPAIKKYLPEYKQNKKVYDQNFDLIIQISCQEKEHPIDAMVHVSYLSTLGESALDVKFPITFQPLLSVEQLHNEQQKISAPRTITQPELQDQDRSWTATLQNLVEQTKTPWTQALFALLLGLLLSLTPCIYPMIPITIGILHSNGKSSFLHNFLGSLSYACGLATTFAFLGLLATVAGSSFGSLLSNTPFVICLVLFIGYMSLTMIGIVDMYVPSFMKGEVKFYRNLGPFVAAYLFGAISGTIASPCVSPGLALLLSIVATLGNNILGFFLLFAFGIGLSIPLIIIGTFSNSLYLLPKSGMWMVEIKKFLGFFMLATCFYYLANILPLAIVYWLFTAFTLFMALFYLVGTENSSNNDYKTGYTITGIIMIGLTIFMATKSYEKTFYTESSHNQQSVAWQKNYAQAVEHATKNNNLLLIDFWAQHCTICKAIDKKVFHNDEFNNSMKNSITFVKIDATHSNDPDYMYLRELFKVFAQPTLLLIDPTTETVLQRWSSEPYSLSIKEFVEQIKVHIKK